MCVCVCVLLASCLFVHVPNFSIYRDAFLPCPCPLQQQQADGYGGPPPSPVVAGSWGDRAGYVDEGYMRQDPNILPGAGTPIASTTSANGEAAGFMVSTGG